MNERKEKIIMATLELAAQKGLGSVSMNMIAEKVGIKKPSLYNHFASKDEIIEAMYQFLREKSKKQSNALMIDYAELFGGKTALEILRLAVGGYEKMTSQKDMLTFYKVIYSERCFEPEAAKILKEETEKMILATKRLFRAMQVHNILNFKNADMSAVSFAMTVHGLMDFEKDKNAQEPFETEKNNTLLNEYLEWFCKENKTEEKKTK